ncbi:uncharacterized protein LOC141691984 [Apium graveolens]|uniref:uncharacterized protein LOC141691984 n=1 Tax=Apium graveolens TaxID=4045 RepID=UPI003D79D4C4
MHVHLQHITVAGFMNAEGTQWDEEMIRDICNDRDTEFIQRIPLPSNPIRDYWVLLKDDKGMYTVKSCYRWLQGKLNTDLTVFWKKLWSLKVPGKVIDFLWRVCSGCLPTTTALAQKHVNISIFFPWCHSVNETDCHILFGYGFAQSVWKLSNVFHLVQFDPGDTTFMVFHRCMSAGTREQCVLTAMIGWSIWNRRNKWVWERVNGSTFGVLAAAQNLLHDWKEAQVLVDLVYRSTNGVAHLLASAAHSMSGCEEWFVTPPEFINDVLDLDSL